MKSIIKLLSVAGLLAVAISVSPGFTGEAHAYACKGTQYSGAATKKTKMAARHGARKSWTNSMKNQFGLEWSVWSIAAGKSVQCHKTGTKHTCLALARPCQYVVQ